MVQWKNFEATRAMFWNGLWHDVDSAHFDGREDALTVRPLVVIDPEDREQVERFAIRQQDFYYESGAASSTWADLGSRQQNAVIDASQAALREFANPTPPIEEPTNVGAVVEDDKGRRWVFTGDIDSGGSWWLNATEPERWPDINVTRVLSEGVPAEATA